MERQQILFKLPDTEMHPLQTHINKVIPISDSEFQSILAHFKEKKFKKHQFLVQIDEPVENDYWILKGLAKSYYTDQEGKEHILQFAMEDWWISDYQAYFNRTKAALQIDCIEDCEVLVLSLENREKLCVSFQKMEHFFRKKSNAGYVGLQRRILSLLTSSAEQRYDQLLSQHPALFQRVPKKYLAAYLGVSRETLSRFQPH